MNPFTENDLVFYNDEHNNIHSCGLSVNSFLMKNNIPIMYSVTKDPLIKYQDSDSDSDSDNNDNANHDIEKQYKRTNKKVSEIFKNLVVPNWAFSHNNEDTNSNKSNSKVNANVKETYEDNVYPENDILMLLKKLKEDKESKSNKNNKKSRKLKRKKKQNISKKRKIFIIND